MAKLYSVAAFLTGCAVSYLGYPIYSPEEGIIFKNILLTGWASVVTVAAIKSFEQED